MANATMLARRYFQKEKEGRTGNPEIEPVGQASLSQPPLSESRLEVKTPLREVPVEVRDHVRVTQDSIEIPEDMPKKGVSASEVGHFQTFTRISFDDLKKKFSKKKKRRLNPKKGIDWFNLQNDVQGEREEIAKEALAELEEDLNMAA